MTTLLPVEARGSLSPAALSCSVSALGGSDCGPDGVVQLERLNFPSLDEPMLIEMRLEQHRRRQQRHRWIGRAVGAGVGLATGIAVDGFDLGDLTSGFLGGAVGDLTVEGIQAHTEAELDRLGLNWAIAPESLHFHQRRHGQALNRVLLLALRGSQLRTTCGVRFADGFLAFFSPDLYQCDLAVFDGTRRLSGKGAMPELGATPRQVGALLCSDGRERPLQAVITDKGPLLAMEFQKPHHSLY